MNARALPQHIKESIDRYVSHRIPTGGFLEAVLSNNLREAFGLADEPNQAALPAIVQYVTWEIPADCHGSREAVREWLHPVEAEVQR